MTKQILFVAAILTSPFLAHSQSSAGAISGALAGTGRSSVDVGESYIMNPASVAHLRGAAILFGTTASNSNLSDHTVKNGSDGWHLSLNENNRDSVIGSSIYLSQTRTKTFTTDSLNRNTLETLQQNDAWFTVGNFIFPQLSVGLSYHLHESQTEFKKYLEHNFGLGFLWTPLTNLGIGISLQNLRSPDPEVPEALALGSTGGIGLLYLPQEYLRLRLDYSRKIHRLTSLSYTDLAFGIENSMTPWLLARIGLATQLNEDQESTQKFTFGLGFSGPRFGIHYGFQQFQMAQRGSEHSVDFMIPF